MMGDVCDKELYHFKILKAIDYIKSVSQKKPTKEGILKHMARSNLKLQEEVLQMLIDNLEEEGILENRGDDSNQCFYLKESIESYTMKREKATEIIDSTEDDTQDRPILEMLTPLPNESISGDIKELEDFFDRQAGTCLKSKNDKKDNVSIHVCQKLFFSQEEQIKSQREFIFFLQKELESKQRVIDNLLKTLTVCLHTQSSMRDERYFSSQSQKFNFTQNKLEKSVITINDNKETQTTKKRTQRTR